MEKGLKLGLMELVTKVIMLMERNTAMGGSHGLMEAHMMDSSLITISMDRESTNGQMVDSMKVIGRIIKWKEEEFLHGLTIEDMKESTMTTKKKGMVSFIGLMGENMKVSGKMENNMELGFTHQHQENKRKANGLKEREFHGSNETAAHDDII